VRRRLLASVLLGAIATVAASSITGAQSLHPSGAVAASAPPSPGTLASASPADCTAAAALLPRTVDRQHLDAVTSGGVSAIDPDELLDPLLGSLGRSRADVCVVAFRYGAQADALAGQLVRIQGVHVDDLAQQFLDAIRAQLVAYGAQASPASDVEGGVWTLDVSAGGQRSHVVATQLGDVLLVTSDAAAMDRLLPLLALVATSSPAPGEPSPSTPSRSLAPSSPASLVAASPTG